MINWGSGEDWCNFEIQVTNARKINMDVQSNKILKLKGMESPNVILITKLLKLDF